MPSFTCFPFAPAAYLPLRDRALLDRLTDIDLNEQQGRRFECPDFELKVCVDVCNTFALDLYCRIRQSDAADKKLVLLLPSPENAAYASLAEAMNVSRVSARNVHVFFLSEYANDEGDVAPWQSPYSRAGQFMRFFYERLDESLRMPMEQLHFWTRENVAQYSDLLAAEGGADVAYTSLSWSGGIGAIDAESFPAETMDEFLSMGSRLVTPMPETITQDSMRGLFGCSGDIGNVPPRAATVGPRDLVAARERVDIEYLVGVGGSPAWQKYPLRLSLFAPVSPKNPGSLLRLYPGVCYVAQVIADRGAYKPDNLWLAETIETLRREE